HHDAERFGAGRDECPLMVNQDRAGCRSVHRGIPPARLTNTGQSSLRPPAGGQATRSIVDATAAGRARSRLAHVPHRDGVASPAALPDVPVLGAVLACARARPGTSLAFFPRLPFRRGVRGRSCCVGAVGGSPLLQRTSTSYLARLIRFLCFTSRTSCAWLA